MLEPGSDAEVDGFEAWLNSDSDHAAAYAAFDQVAALGERLPRRTSTKTEEARRQPRLVPAFALPGIAILAAFGAVWVVAQNPQRAEAAINNFGPSTRAVRLQDGTAVVMDSGAEFTVRAAPGGSEVTLQRGRARFRTSPGGARPLSVSASGAVIQAHETVFDVSVDGATASVHVLQGTADVTMGHGADPAGHLTLAAGQGIEVRNGRIAEEDQAAYDPRWPAARVSFEDASLASVIARANRLGAPPIKVAEQDVARRRVTGVLDLRDTRTLAPKLAATLGLRVEEREGALLLTP
jgi:transmembrane sensor